MDAFRTSGREGEGSTEAVATLRGGVAGTETADAADRDGLSGDVVRAFVDGTLDPDGVAGGRVEAGRDCRELEPRSSTTGRLTAGGASNTCTWLGRTKTPYFGLQSKYRSPCTDPSFFPFGSSLSCQRSQIMLHIRLTVRRRPICPPRTWRSIPSIVHDLSRRTLAPWPRWALLSMSSWPCLHPIRRCLVQVYSRRMQPETRPSPPRRVRACFCCV